MNEEVAKKIITSIEKRDLFEFEKIISAINANSLGETVIQNINYKKRL
jgi:hypothetical protein